MDIKPENLGVYLDGNQPNLKDKGIFFDLDGLLKIDVARAGRIVTPDFTPPEIPQDDKGIPYDEKSITSAKEMSYQFGVCLKEIIGYKAGLYSTYAKFSLPKKYMPDISLLFSRMTKRNPLDRPTIKEAVKEMEDMLERIKQEIPSSHP